MLIQGGAGAVGICAVQFARRAGATAIAAVRAGADDATAQDAGAHHVVRIGLDLVQEVHALAPQGVSHIVDVAFGANIAADVDMLDVRGSIATCATKVDAPAIPFWLLLFKNIRIDFLGSDDFAPADKEEAARATNEALLSGCSGMPIVEQFPLHEMRRLTRSSNRLDCPGCCDALSRERRQQLDEIAVSDHETLLECRLSETCIQSLDRVRADRRRQRADTHRLGTQ